MKKNNLEQIIELILEENTFLITSHVSPDGDNLGSMLALKFSLELLGKEVKLVLDDTVPNSFSFLPSSEDIEEYSSSFDFNYDIAFVLDCSNLGRIDRVENLLMDRVIVNIDHHGDNPLFGDYNLVKDVAATGELIYDLINGLPDIKLNDQIAVALATALITDTGSFRYSNTTKKTHQIMSKLLEYDVDTAQISKEIFNTNSYQSLILRGKALQKLELDSSGEIAWLKVTKNMLDEAGASWEDTEGLVSYPRSIEGVEVGVLFKEIEKREIRVSLRSNNYLAVDEIAHQFSGGGHPRAAGCTINNNLNQVKEDVVAAIKDSLVSN